MEIDGRELLGDEVEEPCLGEPVDLGVEIEALEDVAHGGREGLQISAQVLGDAVLPAHQRLQVELRRVVEVLPGLAQQEGLGVQPCLLAHGQLGEHGRLGGFQHAVEAPQDGEREDDLAVVGLPIVAAQEIGDRPDERAQRLDFSLCHVGFPPDAAQPVSCGEGAQENGGGKDTTAARGGTTTAQAHQGGRP
jgi:hypothetical protein